MPILLRTSGFLVSATNGLNLLNKQNYFFSFVYFQSFYCMLINTAHGTLLKESHEEVRKQKYTNRATNFALEKNFKCQHGDNHWSLAKCRSSLTSIAPLFQFPLLIFFLSLAFAVCPTLFVFAFYEAYDLEAL